MIVIRTDNLCKTYKGKTTALGGLNLEVHSGEVFGFLGPNGAGKTTTIHLLLNFIRPTKGTAFLFEQPVTCTETHRRLGYLPESVNLHDYYRGGRLLEFYAGLLGLPSAARSPRVEELLKLMDLQEARDKPISKYSKGMLQRIGLAQAMLNDPELLILDEPTSSLDPVGRREFRDILLGLKRRGKTIFISSHILSEVESVCDRVAILQNGQLRRVGTLQELSSTTGARIIVKRLPAELVETLAATTARVTFEQGQVTIHCQDASLRQDVEQLLVQHQVDIERIEPEMQSLEDIFMSAIGQEDNP